MHNFYRVKYTLLKNGELLVSKYARHKVLLDSVPQDREYTFTWKNIDDFPFGEITPIIKNKKRGKILIYDSWDSYFCIKEWKEPFLHFEYKVSYEQVSVSINEVLDYSDGELALMYLAERGVNKGVVNWR